MTPTDRQVEEAIAFHRQGRIEDAASRYEAVLASEPDRFEAVHMLGVARLQQARIEEATSLLGRALEIRPDSFDALCDLGHALALVGRFEDAVTHYGRALVIRPDQADALMARGTALLALDRGPDAAADFERVLVAFPDSHEALFKLGHALMRQQRIDEAVACLDSLVAAVPNHASGWNARGVALWSLNRHDAAIASYDRAIAADADNAEPLYNRGNAWLALNHHQRALDDFDKALALAPSYAQALRSRGHALTNLKRLDEAAASYSQAVRLNPALPYAMGYAAQARAQICDWTDYDANVARMVDEVRRGRRVCDPFTLLCVTDDPADQLTCAKAFVDANFAVVDGAHSNAPHRRHDRVRIAYLSADFHQHATAYLIAELFELHDRARFDVTAISFGPEDAGPMRTRLRAGTDRFVDVRALSDAGVADLIRDAEIDIAVDLKGHTLRARPGIFARRPAPIQVSYLGYPGTTGASFLDYVVADATVIPHGDERFYSESVIRLPGCYQVNDSKRLIAADTPNRSELHLPEDGFVFCCFNANFKITPSVFDVWMRLLTRFDRSVLWLMRGAPAAENNLRREASNRGVDPNRLVFAPWAPLSEHLARHRLADLFLDTLPCNAHTTASDALWSGLPVLTCQGRSFASRVASSLLRALSLPELITTSLREYERQAERLVEEPAMLGALRTRLAQARAMAPLFDTHRFRRNLEEAYERIWDRHRIGRPPASFDVAA